MVDTIRGRKEITRFYWIVLALARSFSNSIVFKLRRTVIVKRIVEKFQVYNEVLLGSLDY